MKKVNIASRIYRTLQVIGWLFSSTWILTKFSQWDKNRQGAAIVFCARKLIKIMNISVESRSKLPQRGTLFAANHISWLDIIILSSRRPVAFVAKQEIRQWWMIGSIAEQIGCIFINREQRKDSQTIAKMMAERLKEGRNIAFFPEARTSPDGKTLLPFKAALFDAAIFAQKPVCAVAIQYFDENNNPNLLPAYTEDVTLVGSVMNVISAQKTSAVLTGCIYQPQENEDRFAIKDKIEAYIRSTLYPESSTESL